jgi:hypothetical protein
MEDGGDNAKREETKVRTIILDKARAFVILKRFFDHRASIEWRGRFLPPRDVINDVIHPAKLHWLTDIMTGLTGLT